MITRRERAKREERRRDAEEAASRHQERILAHATASDYLHHLKALVKRLRRKWPRITIRVVLYCRVSGDPRRRRQRDLRRLDGQLMFCLKQLRKLPGVRVIARFSDVESGKLGRERPSLEKAFKAAREHDAILVVAHSSRLLRNRSFDLKGNPHVLPTDAEFEELLSTYQKEGQPVRIATILHPDSSRRDIKAHEDEWGKEFSGNEGGRPPKKIKEPGYKKRWREKHQPRVQELKRQGWPLRKIADQMAAESGRPWSQSTIQPW